MPCYVTIFATRLSADGGFDFLPRSFGANRQRIALRFLAVAFRQIRLIEILHLTALSRRMSLFRFPSTRRSIWRNNPVPVCGCNYFHLRRRSLVQSFLRKDVPPLKLLEANSFPRGNFCEASRVAPLPSPSPPPTPPPPRLSRLLLPRHAFAERA